MDVYCPKCYGNAAKSVLPDRLYVCFTCGNIFYDVLGAGIAADDAKHRMMRKHPMQRNILTLELTHQLYPFEEPCRFRISLGDCRQDGIGVLWADLVATLESWLSAPEKFRGCLKVDLAIRKTTDASDG